MVYIYNGKNPIRGDFTKGNCYTRVDGFKRNGISKGFYIDDVCSFRLLDDDQFEKTNETFNFKTPSIDYISRNKRVALASRWGVTEQTVNNWQTNGKCYRPYRLNDAIKGVLNRDPCTDVLKSGELSEIVRPYGFYISELSVRWGWCYNGETLRSITSNPKRVSLFWDLLAGMTKCS